MSKVLGAVAVILALSGPAHAGGLFSFEEPGDLSGTMGKASAPNQMGETAANPRPPEGFAGQLYTTPDMCTYSRAQAPGYAVQWYLVLNPHHIGMPNAHPGCPTRI